MKKQQTKIRANKKDEKDKPRDGLRLSSPVMPSVINFFSKTHLTDPKLNELYDFILRSMDVHFPDGEDGKTAIFFFKDAAKQRTKYRNVLDCLADHGFDVRIEEPIS